MTSDLPSPAVLHAPLFHWGTLSRGGGATLTAQIHATIRDAILEGRLTVGERLPSWRDLAARLGVARGTVRAAYERLVDEQLVEGRGAAGTWVAARPLAAAPSPRVGTSAQAPAQASAGRAGGRVKGSLPWVLPEFSAPPLVFQMGVPAQDAFPATLWARLMARASRQAAVSAVSYPDPRGEATLRREIAAHLALTRGLRCTPDQVLVTAGYAGALGLVVQTLGLGGRQGGATAWMEDPGFPLTRAALGRAGLRVVPVPVDGEGLDVRAGEDLAGDAALAVVTAGQQAPLGMTLSLARRLALLDWARRRGAWVLEDDYLSDLQLKGRAAPALAALDGGGRVLHAGTFSKILSPALRLGFLVVPPALAGLFAEVAACLAPAPSPVVQAAVAAFLAEGHALRHLRRMKRLYAARRQSLLSALDHLGQNVLTVQATAGLSVVARLPDGSPDVDIARRALSFGLSPVPLSPWYQRVYPGVYQGADEGLGQAPAGLLLGVTNLNARTLAADCRRLVDLGGAV